MGHGMAVVYGYKIHYLASCDAKSGKWQVLIKNIIVFF